MHLFVEAVNGYHLLNLAEPSKVQNRIKAELYKAYYRVLSKDLSKIWELWKEHEDENESIEVPPALG